MSKIRDVISWIENSVLLPLLGEYYKEIFILLSVFICIVSCVVFIIVCNEYRKAKKDCELANSALRKQIVKTKDATESLNTARNEILMLNSVNDKLKIINTDNKKKIEEQSLDMFDKDKLIESLQNELSVMREFKKRSDAARKGAQTRRKKKEEEKLEII